MPLGHFLGTAALPCCRVPPCNSHSAQALQQCVAKGRALSRLSCRGCLRQDAAPPSVPRCIPAGMPRCGHAAQNHILPSPADLACALHLCMQAPETVPRLRSAPCRTSATHGHRGMHACVHVASAHPDPAVAPAGAQEALRGWALTGGAVGHSSVVLRAARRARSHTRVHASKLRGSGRHWRRPNVHEAHGRRPHHSLLLVHHRHAQRPMWHRMRMRVRHAPRHLHACTHNAHARRVDARAVPTAEASTASSKSWPWRQCQGALPVRMRRS
jgi:hypothetical protein